ncbi:MAG: hypothetical protein JXB47_05055 [Anaerolineae bacterium]|nr:hypothetical protein [Anaerolineae bacterium]
MEAIGTYRGQGTLIIDADLQAACQFECIQQSDTQITCRCHIDAFEDGAQHSRLLNAAGELSRAQRLTGHTDAGVAVEAEDLICTGAEMIPNEAFTLMFMARSLRARMTPDLPHGEAVLRFGLTNFEFEGTDYDEAGHHLLLKLAGRSVAIRPLADYTARKRTLWTLKGTQVTCEAVVTIRKPDEHEFIDSLINDLALLLSLARGCQVQWVYRDLIAPDGARVERCHVHIPVKPYSPLALIPVRPPADTRDFVAQTFEQFRIRKTGWELHKAIPLYLEAKLDDDYRVIKGLKVVVLMDFLTGIYFRSHATDQPDEAPILKTLRQALRIETAASYKDTLRVMCDALHLHASDGDLKDFAASRDALVSYARFASERAAWQEYLAMMDLVSRVFLAILRYEGKYNDWTLPADEMRVAFALRPR